MMKQEDLFKKIGLILSELNDQYQFLAQNPQQLNELELELFHANANFLADHVQIIKKISLTQEQPLELPMAEAKPDLPILSKETVHETYAAAEELEEEQQLATVTFVEETAPVVNAPIFEVKEEPVTPMAEIEEEIFKLDHEPSTFEFILNDHAEHEAISGITEMDDHQFARDSFITNENKLNTDEKFDFEEKSVDEIFNRPLSDEEERIIAEKKKLAVAPISDSLDAEEDEIGPEPFLVQQPISQTPIIEEVRLPIVQEERVLQEAPIPAPIVKSTVPVEDPTFKPTLNDLLANKTTASIHTSKPAITDLKQGINLNDKLLYIKDLFNGYNLAYAEAIDLANKLPNFEAADNFFQKNYAAKNNWAEKQATVDQFYELLNQRFR